MPDVRCQRLSGRYASADSARVVFAPRRFAPPIPIETGCLQVAASRIVVPPGREIDELRDRGRAYVAVPDETAAEMLEELIGLGELEALVEQLGREALTLGRRELRLRRRRTIRAGGAAGSARSRRA
jgi:hypothetical protein